MSGTISKSNKIKKKTISVLTNSRAVKMARTNAEQASPLSEFLPRQQGASDRKNTGKENTNASTPNAVAAHM